jgi:ORF6N domain
MERFPLHFMFVLTQDENESLRSQNATLKKGEHSKYLPYAFTEHGVLMLSNVLKSPKAVAISIKIIDVFVKLRESVIKSKDMELRLEILDKRLLNLSYDVTMHDGEIDTIFQLLEEWRAEKDLEKNKALSPRPLIGFNRNKDDTQHG